MVEALRGDEIVPEIKLARLRASDYRASMPTRIFLFTEYFSFRGSASAARSKEKYSVEVAGCYEIGSRVFACKMR
jgi:hypothetical protein